MGGADMIVTVPEPDAAPGSPTGVMSMVSVARAVTFASADQCMLTGMDKEELLRVRRGRGFGMEVL